jgi:glycosyltransferase involved in cell wall biosynthesis
MRLLIATPLYPPELGGPATYAHALEVGLPEHAIETILVKFSEVKHLPKGVRHLLYFWKVLRAGRAADAVLALDAVSVGFPTMLACKLLRKPFFVKIVGDYAWEQGRSRSKMWLPLDEFVHTKEVPALVHVLRSVQKKVVLQAKKIIVPSRYLQSIVQKWGVPEDSIIVIYNAVPSQVVGTVPDVLVEKHHHRVVSAGRLVPWKGMHGLISAMVSVRQKDQHAQLVIVGDGPDKASLERFATARLGEGNVIFTGALTHAETLGVIASADVFVLNSTYEGLSHILIEAMSLGRPIIATNAGGNPELIEDKKTGLLIPVGDSEILSKKIRELLKDSDLANRLGHDAKEKSHEFSLTRMLTATASFFMESV